MRVSKPLVWLVCLVCGAVSAATAEPPIVPADAAVEVVSRGGFAFTEGPALAPDGSIYFTDIPNRRIHRYDPETGKTTRFVDDSGRANGLMFGHGFLWACEGGRRVLRGYEKLGTGDAMRFVPAPDFGGKRFNSPNDLVVTDAGVYFTDPRYGKRDDMEMEIEGVYFVDFDLEAPERVVRVVDDLVRPNGIGLAPDGETLYVNDAADKKIWAYPVLAPDRLGPARLLNDLADLGGGDGMALDARGRVYNAIYGKGVLVLSPGGERLGFIETGPQTTNCVFGADGRTLYVTAEKSLKRVVLNTAAIGQ